VRDPRYPEAGNDLGESKTMRVFATCAIAIFCLAASPALALSDKPYLAATDADFGNLLPPPPADGSAADKRDLQLLLDLQKAATPERLAKAQADVEISVYRLAGEIFGPTFTKEHFPLAGEFFAKINRDSAVGVSPIKRQYERRRPYQASKDVVAPPAIAAAAQSPTYPSGHGTFGAEAAMLLAIMVPEKKTALYARGWEYGEGRIATGVAYPSDSDGGHIGAAVMVTLMLQKPEFRADLEAVKAEVRKGLGLAP
jgi:acid phosphatase (class A)